jgi:hypothetical protein
MKSKIILIFALILGGAWFIPVGRPALLPKIESMNQFLSGEHDEWIGSSFHEIMPPGDVKDIILLDNRHAFFQKLSPQEIKDNYSRLFNQLERSDETAVGPYMTDFEGTSTEFVVVTKSGRIVYIEAVSGLGYGSVSGLLLHSRGFGARFNLTKFQLSATNGPARAAKGPLQPVDMDYFVDQKPGDWNRKRFWQIASPDKIKRVVLFWRTEDILDYVQEKTRMSFEEENQFVFSKLFDDFQASTEPAGNIALANGEHPFARLLLIMDSGEVIYMEIVGTAGWFENGKPVENHISAVLLHSHGKGVRINLNILPVPAAR